MIPGADVIAAKEARVRTGVLARAARDAAAAEQRVREAVADMRAHGASWAEIGAVLGITKQGAHQRFGKAEQ